MLSSINLNDKDYEQLLAEAMAQIPLYSQEWTNMNPSEPGITILENLSAFEALQQNEMNQVPEKIKWKLLALAGFHPEEGRPAVTYMKQNNHDLLDNQVKGQKIYAQNICYELPDQAALVDAPIVGMYVECKGEKKDISELTKDYGIAGGTAIFGTHPKGGEAVYILLNKLPESPQKAILYVDVKEVFTRNAFGEQDQNPFAKITWEVLTKAGKEWKKIKVLDETHQFLISGYIQLDIPFCEEELYQETEHQAFVIRARLTRAQYDIVPFVNKIQGLLTELQQKDTQAVVMQGSLQDGFSIRHTLLQTGVFEVYIKEKDDAYHVYQSVENSTGEQARTYRCIAQDACEKIITTDNNRVKLDTQENIMIACRDTSVMPYKELGVLYGYDEQEMALPLNRHVYARQFSILVMEKNNKEAREDAIVHIVYPNSQLPDEVNYSISEQDNTLTIHDCGIYEGATVLMGDYVQYLGQDGNVLPGTVFHLDNQDKTVVGTSCSSGRRGHYQELFEDVRKRFALDIQEPATLVTQKDCEKMISKIPGLSIAKMKAMVAKEKNEIHVVIKPNSLELFPKLSDIYCKVVYAYFEKRRMLTTKIILEQPKYVPIHVHGVIYVKKHFDHCQEIIEELLSKILNGNTTDKNFGETISFHEIYHAVESLECVEEIYDFSMISGDLSASRVRGLDIQLAQNALYYPGDIAIELSTK